MDQPLDLTITHTKTPFTIEYLTSNHVNQKRKPILMHQSFPLSSLENRLPTPSPTINPLENRQWWTWDQKSLIRLCN